MSYLQVELVQMLGMLDLFITGKSIVVSISNFPAVISLFPQS